jgi:hypothetical protein
MDRLLKSGGIVLIGILVIGGLCLFALFGGMRNLFGGRGGGEQLTGGEGQLGRMYSAVVVDDNGCPVNTTTQFARDDVIYVGVTESSIPQGTSMFVRLYREGRAVEDTQELQADRALSTCVWFEFVPLTGDGFEPGQYEAELIVNGNPADRISFNVTNTVSGGALPQTGTGRAELGQVVMTTAVDGSGCPTDNVNEFYTNETVYMAATSSYIPAGTEMFAVLVYEGSIVEETNPIIADRDMDTCIWFSFEGGTFGSLQPGRYQAELYVDGARADTLSFSVR